MVVFALILSIILGLILFFAMVVFAPSARQNISDRLIITFFISVGIIGYYLAASLGSAIRAIVIFIIVLLPFLLLYIFLIIKKYKKK